METIMTIASIPAILALVNLAKRAGLGKSRALILAVILGVALNVADYLWSASGAYQAAVQGLILGLSAAGLYDVSKTSIKG